MSLAGIRHLQRKASDIADRVGRRLDAGEGATSVVEDLREQITVVDELSRQISDLAASPEGRIDDAELDRLQISFRSLVDKVEKNVKTAGTRGVRITPARRAGR